MKKTDKKTENAIVKALNIVCATALDEVTGFTWITHFVRYSDFPSSLRIACIFDTNDDLAAARACKKDEYLCLLIKDQLNAAGVHIPNIGESVHFDSEESCKEENRGNWHERLG